MNLPSIFRRGGYRPGLTLTRLQDDFDRLFQELGMTSTDFYRSDMVCSCEMTEDKSNFMLKFDMPGVKKEDVRIEVDGNLLSVSAERREEKKADGKKHRYSEISYGSYQRTMTLPTQIDEKKVDAKFADGVLTLTIPKSEQSKSKQIEVH